MHYTLTKETDEDENEIWKYGEDEIEISSVKSSLNALEADSFTHADVDGQLEISLVHFLENAHAEQMEISLYRHDGSRCLCQVNGETVSLIPRGDVVDAICTTAEPTDDNGMIPTDEQPVITFITIYKNETSTETGEETTVDTVDTNDLDATE